MGQSGAIVISVRREEDLGFVFKPAEGLTMENAVSVSLEDRTNITLFFGTGSAFGMYA
jgi:hypothetical protein